MTAAVCHLTDQYTIHVRCVYCRIGLALLKSWGLRLLAGYFSYYDKSLGTFDAARIGRLHCLLSTWERANLLFLQSGGFRVVKLIEKITLPTLIVWGEQDEILPVANAYEFQKRIPTNDVCIIHQCGHVPHVEKPKETADAILRFCHKYES